jgi:hypothetical protein
MTIRQYVDKLEGSDFINAEAQAWIDIREFVESTVMPIVEPKPGGSVNGPGSSLDCTTGLVQELPGLLKRYGITSILDAPCGDWNWMQHVNLGGGIMYLGWDVDLVQIQRNRERFGSPHPRIKMPGPTQWDEMDFRERAACVWFYAENLLTTTKIPTMDAILCRDFLAHLPTEHIISVLARFKASGTKYLLASTYPGAQNDFEYHPEHFAWLGYCERPHDLQERPFALAQLDAIEEIPGPGGVISLPHELGLFQL